MLKVYLAAPYREKDTIRDYAQELRSLGIIVTSCWLEEPHKPATQLHEVDPKQNQKYAAQDIQDVLDADVLVLFTDSTKTIVRAGRHVEFGFALGLNKTILVVGEEFENIFHYLPEVKHFPDWTAVRDELYKLYVENTCRP